MKQWTGFVFVGSRVSVVHVDATTRAKAARQIKEQRPKAHGYALVEGLQANVWPAGVARGTGRVSWRRFLSEYDDYYITKDGARGPVADSRHASWKKTKVRLTDPVSFFDANGVHSPDAVSVFHVEAWRQQSKLSAATITKSFKVCSAAWKWAIRKGYAHENPWRSESEGGAPRPRVQVKDVEVPTDLEVERVLSACYTKYPSLYVPVLIASEAALRVGEIERLTWGDIELDLVRVRCDDTAVTKGRRGRVVPWAVDVGREVIARSKDFSAPWASSMALSKAFGIAAKTLDIETTMHGLRRWRATKWAEEGRSLYEVRDLLGHASIKTTERYYVARNGGRDGKA